MCSSDLPTESEVAGRPDSPSATVPPAGPDHGRKASEKTLPKTNQPQYLSNSPKVPEVEGRPTCPSAVVPPSGPGVEGLTGKGLQSQHNPIGIGQSGSDAAGSAANPVVGCRSSGSDPLAFTDEDIELKEDNLYTEEELHQHEGWEIGRAHV